MIRYFTLYPTTCPMNTHHVTMNGVVNGLCINVSFAFSKRRKFL